MISLSHQCVFVHIPKCAGQSVETAFLNEMNLTWKQRAVLLLRSKVGSDPKEAPPKLAHLMARQYVDLHYLPENLFKSYFVFSMVRNPWARVYSFYKYTTKQKISFDDYVSTKFAKIFQKHYWFMAPQTDYLCDKSGRLIVENIIRLENSQEISQVFGQLGFSNINLPHVNISTKSTHCPDSYKSAYGEKSYQIVQDLYHEDITGFDYAF